MLLGYLQIHLANAEEALLLLCSSHCRRCRCDAAAAARMRERTLVAGCQLIHWPGIRWDAQFLVHVRRLWPEAAAVQGAAYDTQGVLVDVTPILAVGIPVGKHTKKRRQNMIKRSTTLAEGGHRGVWVEAICTQIKSQIFAFYD